MPNINCPDYLLLQWKNDRWHVVTWSSEDAINPTEAEEKQRSLKAQGEDSLLVRVTPIKASSIESDRNA